MHQRSTGTTVTRGPRVPDGPRVSVVIPAYGTQYLDEALESVRAQTYRSFEIIVVDDGSPEPVAPRRSDDLVMVRQRNQGPGAARNIGARVSRGELVALLDSDDRWLPEKLERQIAAHDALPGCVLSFTDVRVFGGSGPPAVQSMRERYGCRDAVVPFDVLFRENCVVCSSAITKRDAYLAVGGMEPGRRFGEDFGLWMRLGLRGIAVYVEQVLGEQRIHADSLMAEAARNQSARAREAEVYDSFFREYPALRDQPFARAALARFEAQGGYHMIERAEWDGARAAFERSLRLRPTQPKAWAQWLRALTRAAALGASIRP